MTDRFHYVIKRGVSFNKFEYYREIMEEGAPEEEARKRHLHVGELSFEIVDKKQQIPTMSFLNEDDMMTVYNLLKSKHMIFGGCND